MIDLDRKDECKSDAAVSPSRAQLISALRMASAKLHTNPVDPQTGKPIKMTVSAKAMAKFLDELAEE
jgi:hypothetical protein